VNLTIVLEGLQQDLQGLAELGDERSAQIAQRLGDALSSNLRLKLFDLLSQAALEVSAKLPSGHVEVRLAGQEPELVFVDEAGDGATTSGEELTARISLRSPSRSRSRRPPRARASRPTHGSCAPSRARPSPARRGPPASV